MISSTRYYLLLPVKSIGRFKFVSKSWRSFLSSSQFAKLHLDLHAHDPRRAIFAVGNPGTGFCNADGEKIPLISKFETGRKDVRGSCNGLVLVLQVNKDHITTLMFLLNPVTLETLEVPILVPTSCEKVRLGLGYDSIDDDYKIFWINCNYSHEHCYYVSNLTIFSVKTKTWRRRLGNFPYKHINKESGVLVNGCLHWLAQKNDNGLVIAAFDLASGKIENIENSMFTGWGELSVLGGCLAYISSGNSFAHVWWMKEYGVQDSWTSLSIYLPREYSRSIIIDPCFLDEDMIALIYANHKRTPLAYNLRNREWRSMNLDLGYVYGVSSFRESLVSPSALINCS